jgi:hypothetical protein
MGYADFLKRKSNRTSQATTTSVQEMGQVKLPSPPSNAFGHSSGTSTTSVSRPQSSSLSSNQARASRRQTLDVVKHQVMINYLYQQQGNNGWRSSNEGQSQGIFLRLSKDNYLTHPLQLAQSALAEALKNLNVQVSIVIPLELPTIDALNRPQ